MTDLIKLYESLKEKIGEETAKLLVDTISKIYSNGYIKNEEFLEIIKRLDEFAKKEDLDKLSNYIIELSRAIEGRMKSFEDIVKFEFSNIWQELKRLREVSATKDDIRELKDDIKRLENRIGKIEENQTNFATKDDIKRLEDRIGKIEENQTNFATKDDIKELKEAQKNFATKDDIKRIEKRIERIEKMILSFSISIILSILGYFIVRIFLP